MELRNSKTTISPLQTLTWAFQLIIFLGFIGSPAFAQTLIIESPSPGPITRVYYGQLTANEFILFEKKYILERNEQTHLTLDNSDPSSQVAKIKAEELKPIKSQTTVLTSMQLGADELSQCTSSKRFKGFISLVSNLKGKVNSAKLQVSADGNECADKIIAVLEKAIGGIRISSEGQSEDGLRIELGLASESTVEKAQPAVQEGQLIDSLSFERILSLTRLKIGNAKVSFLPSGWFILETRETKQELIELEVPGRKKISVQSFPLTVTKDPKVVNTTQGYSAYLAQFSKKSLNIYISNIPFLAQTTTIDGGAGGGIGYGREVPGERRGDRLVSIFGAEQRDIWRSFGARGSLLYTNAKKTVVPHTFTLRGTGFYDYSFIDDSLVLRISGGAELFYSKILDPVSKPGSQEKPETALIPSQVTSPLLSLSLHKIFANGLILTPSIHVTPMYISSIGFYSSTSPSLEIGYKVSKNLIFLLNIGSEMHRFPSVEGETKLQMDYTVLTLKRGVM